MAFRFSALIGLGVTFIVIACSSTSTTPTPTPAPTACPGKKTCPAGVGVCGSQDDGCGGTLDCGECPDGQKCVGAADGINRCIVCLTKTKDCNYARGTASAYCGTIDDKCDGTITCPVCEFGPCTAKSPAAVDGRSTCSCGHRAGNWDSFCPLGMKAVDCLGANFESVVPVGCVQGDQSTCCPPQ